jgi:hypothetical protein
MVVLRPAQLALSESGPFLEKAGSVIVTNRASEMNMEQGKMDPAMRE